MAKFIELHNSDDGTPVIINREWITYIKPDETGSIVRVGEMNEGGMQNHFIVRESFQKIKDELL